MLVLHMDEVVASQVVSTKRPLSDVLVPTSHEFSEVEGVCPDAKNGKFACVPKRNRPLLLPLEDLDAESWVHATRYQLHAIA